MARVRRVTLNTVVIPIPVFSSPPNPPMALPATRIFTEDFYLNTIDTILDQEEHMAIPDLASFDDHGSNLSGSCDGVVVAEVTNKAINRINFTLETPGDTTTCSSSSSTSSPPPPPFPSDTLQSPVPSDLLSAPSFDFDWSSCLEGATDNITDVSASSPSTLVTIEGSNNGGAKEEVSDIVDDLNVLGVDLDSLMLVSEKLQDHPTPMIGPALPTKLFPTSSRHRPQNPRKHHHPLVGTILCIIPIGYSFTCGEASRSISRFLLLLHLRLANHVPRALGQK